MSYAINRWINRIFGAVAILSIWEAMILWAAAGVEGRSRSYALYSVFCALVIAIGATRSIWRDRVK